ncbi:hypothetical protein DY000_02056685 [Brassica cretica]|uniref:FBD domain-containing protein n=1 Tax=Brassica cretica TaxID=69181 RepID=A0ABQ7AEQ2_BRACR|nr:hypothetical protein DY000_02056685 [Brassica cretica]
MSFDAPSLVSLDYTDYALYKYPLVNFESLLEAKLNLYYSENIKRPDITGLIIGISNVQTLHLCGGSVDVISRCVKHGLVLPVFKNLVKLSFATGNKKSWKLLPCLLKQSPKVETLIIKGNDGDTCDVTIGLLQVKVLDVLGYKGTAKEFEHLKSLFGVRNPAKPSFLIGLELLFNDEEGSAVLSFLRAKNRSKQFIFPVFAIRT